MVAKKMTTRTKVVKYLQVHSYYGMQPKNKNSKSTASRSKTATAQTCKDARTYAHMHRRMYKLKTQCLQQSSPSYWWAKA